jgi:hypothetical protein
MTLRNKIFNSFAIANDVLTTSETSTDESDKTAAINIFSHDDPFDFFRKIEKQVERYIPVTQNGLRKSFVRGLSGIEFYIVMATSLRPLADEAQDIDEIARLLSQNKLTRNPNLHSVSILRNLIKDENPEIALYAAEGLNTIENAFIDKIQRIKDRIDGIDIYKKNTETNYKNKTVNENSDDTGIDLENESSTNVELSKNKKNNYILFYILGLLYFEFAKLLHGQRLIQLFYLKEAVSSLKTAHEIKKNNKRILFKLGESFMLMGRNKSAIKIFTYLFTKNNKDAALLMRLGECYYNTGDYQNVVTLANLAAKHGIELDEISNLIIYQWLLNI